MGQWGVIYAGNIIYYYMQVKAIRTCKLARIWAITEQMQEKSANEDALK